MSSMASFSSLMAAAMLLSPTGPPPNLSMIVRSSLRSTSSNPCSSTSSSFKAASATSSVIVAVGAHLRVVADPPQQPVRDPRRPARAPGDLRRGGIVDRHGEDSRRAAHDLFEVGGAVELEPVHDAEPRAQRRGQQPGARRRADQRELLERHLHRARARTLADDDVELVVLERGIEDLLDRRRHPVDLVDEQHLALAEVGEDRGQIARLLEHRARRRADLHAQLVRRSRRRASSCRGRAGRRAARDRAPRARCLAAAIDTCRFSRTRSCPMYSSSVRGRRPASYCASSSTRAAVTTRSSVIYLASSLSACFSVRSKSPSGVALDRRVDGLLGKRPMIPQVDQRREQVVAQQRRGVDRRGRAAAPPARTRGRRSFSSSTIRSDGLLADAGNRRQPRQVAALDRANQIRAVRCPRAPPAPPSGRCR